MRRGLLRLSLFLILLDPIAPALAGAACSTAFEIATLATSLRGAYRCAKTRIDQSSAAACDVPAAPACAGSGVDDLLALVAGNVPAAPRNAPELRSPRRCQRAILGAAKRYLGRRIGELASGVRPARMAAAFSPVAKACHGLAVQVRPDGALPTLGAPCDATVAPGTPIDGTAASRCARATIERIAAGMVGGVLRPNVVLILTDDQNYASAALMERVSRLRRRGVDFVNAFATTPICAPSRASLLSARYPQHHGVLGNFLAATTFDASSTLATWLDDAGYATALAGKYMNYAEQLTEVPPGWDEWQVLLGEESGGNGYTDYRIDENGVEVQHGGSAREYSTDLLAERGLRFVKDHAQVPFFLLYAPFAPHPAPIPAQRHLGAFFNVAPWRPGNWHEPDVTLKPNWVKYMKATTTPESTARVDAERVAQLETLLAVDEAVGRFEDTLESLGLADNTVLIFTSDHGSHFGEHWWTSKFSAYDESLRVPLVVSYPVGAPVAAQRSEMVANIDLAPTIAELAGATVPAGLDGRSAAALLAGPATVRSDIFIRLWGGIVVPPWEGVRGERFKYVRLFANNGVLEELYDVIADPLELWNLAFDPAYVATLEAMRLRLAELRD